MPRTHLPPRRMLTEGSPWSPLLLLGGSVAAAMLLIGTGLSVVGDAPSRDGSLAEAPPLLSSASDGVEGPVGVPAGMPAGLQVAGVTSGH